MLVIRENYPIWPVVALPRPKFGAPVHQDCIQDRLAEVAGTQEVSRRNKLSRRKATPQSSGLAMW
ncbi:MAG: hypothetical protein PHQ34_09290 [Methanothrix sp.]|nr:hypothetical protein [Methanothrix sp.]